MTAKAAPEPPTEIVIGPHTYTVFYEREDWELAVAAGVIKNPDSLGHSNGDTCEIHVRPHNRGGGAAMSESQIRATVVHELLHGIFQVQGCDLRNVRDHDTLDLEEYICSVVEPYLFGVLKDNPDLLAWIAS